MEINLEEVEKCFKEEINNISSLKELEELKQKYLSKKKGIIVNLLKEIPKLSQEEKRFYGPKINKIKENIEKLLGELAEKLLKKDEEEKRLKNFIDVTIPGSKPPKGMLHPVTLVRRKIEEIFYNLGYSVEDAPEIEQEWYNFTALNMPEDHPARDSQDTFYLKPPYLLRTHTSNVQIRTMLKRKPPFLVLAPGRVFRRDDSPRHSPMFHQIEGFGVGKDVNFSNFKATLSHFLVKLFGENIEIRFRPSFFPFTEPSAEVDVSCIFCKKKGCSVCSHSGYIEILGSGMIHPQVLRNVNIDPKKWMGFAFGMGIDRICMLLYGIPNIRMLFESDLRVLRQFK